VSTHIGRSAIALAAALLPSLPFAAPNAAAVEVSAERIEQAKQDWRQQRMGTIPGEHEWIPLP